MVAIRVHAGQTDKQGEPYLLHVLRVVEAVSDEAKVVAALHDVVEDGADDWLKGWSDGLGYAEIAAVGLLTRDSATTTYATYIDRLAIAEGFAARLAREVKLADLRDNLGRIPKCRPGFLVHGVGADRWASLKARYERAIDVLSASKQQVSP
jgi:hypothetical protein